MNAFLSATRDILTDNASTDQAEGRLWAAKTLVSVKTQVLSYREVPDIQERFITQTQIL